MAFVVLLPLALVLTRPTEYWEPLSLIANGRPLYPIGAEIRPDGSLWAAARFLGSGPQGPRNYVLTVDDVLATQGRQRVQFDSEPVYDLRARILPISLLPPAKRAWASQITRVLPPDRLPIGEAFVGEPCNRHRIAVQTLGLSEEERDDAESYATDGGPPVPPAWGAIVVLDVEGEQLRTDLVEGMRPIWPPEAAHGSNTGKRTIADPPAPTVGPAVICDETGNVWIGVPGVDRLIDGGLWWSADRGQSWRQHAGVASVNSLLQWKEADGETRVLAATSYFERWNGVLVPSPAYAMGITPDGGDAESPPLPPFGTRSEIELVGSLRNRLLVRVDSTIYCHAPRPVWQMLLADMLGHANPAVC